MEKKMYMKPSMQVVELRRHQPLLAGSVGPDKGYIPGMREDMNQMA
jgi:hypothetical protein